MRIVQRIQHSSSSEFVFIIISKGDYVFTHVHFLVGWLVGRIIQKLLRGSRAWMEDWSQPRSFVMDKERKVEKFFSPSLALWDNAFFQRFVKSSRNNPWILMEKLKKGFLGGWYLMWVEVPMLGIGRVMDSTECHSSFVGANINWWLSNRTVKIKQTSEDKHQRIVW